MSVSDETTAKIASDLLCASLASNKDRIAHLMTETKKRTTVEAVACAYLELLTNLQNGLNKNTQS